MKRFQLLIVESWICGTKGIAGKFKNTISHSGYDGARSSDYHTCKIS